MNYGGIITPMITPFKKDGSIDENATALLIDEIDRYGVGTLFPLGSTGVFPYLSLDERKHFLKFVRDHSKGKTIIAGIGSSIVQESIEIAKFAADIGINAIVLMPAYYIKPNQEGIISQFTKVLSHTDLDLFIYNIPQLSGQWINIDTIEYLKTEFSQIRGVKDSSGDIRYFQQLTQLVSSDFTIFQGQDDLLYSSMMLGASGGVCGTTNLTDDAVRIYNLIRRGQTALALRIQLKVIVPMMNYLNSTTFPTGYYLYFYHKNNISGGYRVPMVEPAETSIRRIIDGMGFLVEESKKYK